MACYSSVHNEMLMECLEKKLRLSHQAIDSHLTFFSSLCSLSPVSSLPSFDRLFLFVASQIHHVKEPLLLSNLFCLSQTIFPTNLLFPSRRTFRRMNSMYIHMHDSSLPAFPMFRRFDYRITLHRIAAFL